MLLDRGRTSRLSMLKAAMLGLKAAALTAALGIFALGMLFA
jgi:hypothetical protein